MLETEALMEKESARARALAKKGFKREKNELIKYLIEDFKVKDRRIVYATPSEQEALKTLMTVIEPQYVFEEHYNTVEKIEALRWALQVSEETHAERMVGLKDNFGRSFCLEKQTIKLLVWQPEKLGLPPSNGLRLYRNLTRGKNNHSDFEEINAEVEHVAKGEKPNINDLLSKLKRT